MKKITITIAIILIILMITTMVLITKDYNNYIYATHDKCGIWKYLNYESDQSTFTYIVNLFKDLI